MPIKAQEAQRTQNTFYQKITFSCHIIINTKHPEQSKNIKAAREKGQVLQKCRPIRVTCDFSVATIKARRAWTDMLQTLENHRCQPILLQQANLLIAIDRENTKFHDKLKFKHLATNTTIQKVIEGKL